MIATLTALAMTCSVQAAQPALGADRGRVVTAALTIDQARAFGQGMPGVAAFGPKPVAGNLRDGLRIDGARTRDGYATWAWMRPAGAGAYDIEWLVRDLSARHDGTRAVSIAKGTCRTRDMQIGAGA